MVIKRTIETPFMQPQDVEIKLTPAELRMAHQEMQEELRIAHLQEQV